MADDVRIVFTGESKGAIESIQQTHKALANMETTVSKTDSIMDKMFKSGGFANISKRDLRESLMGLSIGLEAIVTSAGGADSELAKATNTITRFVTQAMYLSPVGMALMGIGLAIGKMTEKTPQVQALLDRLKKLGETDPAVVGLAQLAGVTEAQATIALQAAASNDVYAKRLYEVSVQAQQQVPLTETLTKSWDQFVESVKGAIDTLMQIASMIVGTGAYVTQFALSLKEGADVQRAMTEASEMGSRATFWFYNQVRISTTATQQNSKAQRELNELIKAAPQYTQEYIRALDEQRKAQEAIVRQAVESALAPTAVTDQEQRRLDLLKEQARINQELADEGLGGGKRRQLQSRSDEIGRELGALGPYKDKWDEFRRRLDDIAQNAIDPAKYGALFANQLETLKDKMNVSVAELSERFRDFSLFADASNLVYINWPELDAQVRRQLDALIGKHNVIKKAVEEAWRNLTKDQRAALREMGVESARDATKVLGGTVGGLVGTFTSKEGKEKFIAAGQGVIANLKAGMLDKDTIKNLSDAAQQSAQTILDYFAHADTIKQFVDAGIAIVNQIAQGIKQQSSVLGDVLTNAVMKAIADATAAAGGNPAVPGAGAPLPTLPAGERQHQSGVGSGMIVQLVYSPQVSLATRAEAESVIAPYVARAVREATSRRML